jgi:glutathione S-transferase
MALTLYRLEGCAYCERVARQLTELGLTYDSVWVETDHSLRTLVKQISGQRGVPVLVDDDTGVTMAESENILEYLNRTYADGE